MDGITVWEAKVLLYLAANSYFGENYARTSKIVSSLAIKKSNLSRIITSLQEKGLAERVGRGKVRLMMDIKPFSEVLKRYGELPLEKVISGSRAAVIVAVGAKGGSTGEISKRSKLSSITVKKTLSWLTYTIPVLYKRRKGLYAIREETRAIANLVSSIKMRMCQHFVRKVFGSFLAAYELEDNILVIAKRKDEMVGKFQLAGLSIFHKYGVPLIMTSKNYYAYSKTGTPFKMEDAVLHALYFNPEDARTLLYCLLVLSKNKVDKRYFLQKAKEYGFERLAHNLLLYLDTKGKAKENRFPGWKEFIAKRRVYG